MLFAGLGSVRIVKNCDRGLENAARGLQPRAAFLSPRSQPANNIYISTVCLTGSGTISIHAERLQTFDTPRKQNESI